MVVVVVVVEDAVDAAAVGIVAGIAERTFVVVVAVVNIAVAVVLHGSDTEQEFGGAVVQRLLEGCRLGHLPASGRDSRTPEPFQSPSSFGCGRGSDA